MKAIQKLNKFKNNARRITNLVFRGLSGAYERGGRSASPVTTGASDSVSEKHLNGDSSCVTHFVLRHGLFLSLYSLIKKASDKLPWRSRTNHNSDFSSASASSSYSRSSVSTSARGLNTTRNYIKNFRRIRVLGSASLFSLGLLLLATFVPLYNVTRTEDTEAAAGTAKDSSITFTATRSTASVDLTVTSENGTFASSTDGTNGTTDTRAAFSISTTNFTGYTLTIASNSNTSTLTNANGGTLSSISEPIDESTFNTTAYNNKWGYKPNYYDSAANSNYLQSPTTTASTLDETSTANSTAKNYTIALGARADYTNASGTYSSSNYKLMYVANPTGYEISYDAGNANGTVSGLPKAQSDSVSAITATLSSDTPSQSGYDFTGWCLGTITTTNNVDTCSNANVYNPNGDGTNLTFGIDRTTANNVTLHAMWKIKTFTCSAQYRLQNADGTFPEAYTPDTANNSTVTYGSSCSYSKTIADYKNSASGTNGAQASTSATNVTENKTLSLDFYRNTYTLTASNGSNVSNTKFTTTAVHGDNYFRWGQAVALSTTKATNVTCTTYATPTWTQSGTTGTFSSTSGTSVNFTMGKGNVTVTAKSTASNKSQTVTLSKGTGVSSIKIGSSTYSGSSASLTCGSYTISGNYDSNYEFSSWSRSGSVTVSSTSNASTTMTVNGTGTLTLNAKQSCIAISGTMQAFTGTGNYCGTSGTLTDSRDNERYLVAKLADGKWWMLDNLRLGVTDLTTDITSSNTNTNTTIAKATWNGYRKTSGFYVYDSPMFNSASANSTTTSYGSGSGKIGVYYNYCAASAGTYCYASGSGTGNASYDICPKGWRMPTGGSSGEYQALYTAYSSNDTNFRAALSTPLSGCFYYSSAVGQGSNGRFWSSTYSDGYDMYNLYVYSSDVNPTSRDSRDYGFSVRCILK